MRERGAYIYIIYLFININIYVKNGAGAAKRRWICFTSSFSALPGYLSFFERKSGGGGQGLLLASRKEKEEVKQALGKRRSSWERGQASFLRFINIIDKTLFLVSSYP